MKGAESITTAIRIANQAGRPAMVAFLTAGFPERARFGEHLLEIAAEADVVEIGVPFTDPMADGVTIQRASEAALAAGVSLGWILEELGSLAPRPAAPLILMSYLNPLLALGLESLAERAAAVGVAGFVVPDLPLEESEPFRAALAVRDLGLVQLVTPVSRGFVYAVTVTGITGGSSGAAPGLQEYLDRVRRVSPLPVCAGFGIRSSDQVEALAPHADGVVVGSALVEAMARGEAPGGCLRQLRGTSRA